MSAITTYFLLTDIKKSDFGACGEWRILPCWPVYAASLPNAAASINLPEDAARDYVKKHLRRIADAEPAPSSGIAADVGERREIRVLMSLSM